ncbi:hypothetical protein JTE90_025063 [Oedothorax gibbosus]|uniref:Reverse transcriptase domain-containing protein n=1 Tax=Oedothorax gibbosus TaxID=931172 RepID=A0AAV6TRP9_9ARAC|nr:hypothetical protein JTE90_025063 [Oedothorax gibbosus]
MRSWFFYSKMDYLGDRKSYLPNGDMEISKAVERGCPQGSCSGPLLWNMIADEALKLNWPDGCYAQAYARHSTGCQWGHQRHSRV